MRRNITKVGILAAAALLAVTSTPSAWAGQAARRAAAGTAYFEFVNPPGPDRFVFALTDPAKIQRARDIVSGKEDFEIHVLGTIVKSSAPYNPGWSYHLDPATIEFFGAAVEVCDATPRYVEEHLDEAGGAFLPNSHWCPWASRVSREVCPPYTTYRVRRHRPVSTSPDRWREIVASRDAAGVEP